MKRNSFPMTPIFIFMCVAYLIMESWNEIDVDELMLSQDGMIEHDIAKMVEICNEKK